MHVINSHRLSDIAEEQLALNPFDLTQVPLFASLPSHELQHLATVLQTRDLAAGSILFHEGKSGDHFYVLLNGEVEIVKAMATADERVLSVRGPGEFFGEMSLLNPGEPRSAAARARSPAQLLALARADFEALVDRQPTLAFEITRVLSLQLRQMGDAMIADLREKNRRLAAAYQELHAAHAQIVEKEKLERELEVAYEIQTGILPRVLPSLEGYDFGARMVPARAVGGDFFDFIPLGTDRMGILIGDVADKGVPAAIFMAQSRALLRAEASHPITPREVLERVNAHLLQMNEPGLFVTVLYGILDGTTGHFTYARAGHDLPLLQDAIGELLPVPRSPGQPLGLFGELLIDEQVVTIPHNGTLLLYTDGVTDTRNPTGESFGKERLGTALATHTASSAQSVCDHLLQLVLNHSVGFPQDDDVTLVIVRSHT